MNDPWGSLDRLVGAAEALAGAWGTRVPAPRLVRSAPSFACSASTDSTPPADPSPGPRSIAGWPVSRTLGSGSRCRLRWRSSRDDLEPQQLARDVASGAVDLALETALLLNWSSSRRRSRGGSPRHQCNPAYRRRADGPSRHDGDAWRSAPAVARGDPPAARRGRRAGGGRRPDRGRSRPDPDRGSDRTRACRSPERRGPGRSGVATSGRCLRRPIAGSSRIQPRSAVSGPSPSCARSSIRPRLSAERTSAWRRFCRHSGRRKGPSWPPSSGST